MREHTSWIARPAAGVLDTTARVHGVGVVVGARALTALFAVTLLLGSTLIFIVEPMFAKMVLPLLGGSPAVWNTCVVFFQGGLLAGYAYAHLSTTWLTVRQQAILHGALLLLAALVLPVAVPAGWTPPVDSSPVWLLLLSLSVGLGAPFVVVSATAPLLQKWFASTDHPSAHDPYYLYSASNAGSIVALLAYPFFVERAWSLLEQSRLWTLAFGGFAVLSLSCAAVAIWRRRQPETGWRCPEPDDRPAAGDAPLDWGRRVHWIALAFVPSSLLLGVTTYLSTDIAAVPLMWTIPLTLYLLSFVLAFAPVELVPSRLTSRAMPLLVSTLAVVMAAGFSGRMALALVPLHLIVLFICGLELHSTLARRRPGTRHLTEFYFWVATGGVLGGLFNTLLAPLLFTAVAEYPLALVAACLLRPSSGDGRRLVRGDVVLPVLLGTLAFAAHYGAQERVWPPALAIAAVSLLGVAAFSFSRRPVRFGLAIGIMLLATQVVPGGSRLYAERTFFGVVRVNSDEATGRHLMEHGSTVHGEQRRSPERRGEPLSYYHRAGPIGQVMQSLPPRYATARVGVVGLGAGSLAAYARPGQQWTFYELDPLVAALARDPRYFTYLSECAAVCDVVLGDARLSLSRAAGTTFDLLVLDAFSSDAIPVHLMTREAIELYMARLAPDGLLAFHISNSYLSLRPVLAALAAERGLAMRAQQDNVTAAQRADGHYASEWVIMARTEDALDSLALDARWARAVAAPGSRVWTDDFSDIVAVLKPVWK